MQTEPERQRRMTCQHLRHGFSHWMAVAFVIAFGIAASTECMALGVCEKIIISADPAYPPLHWYDGSTMRGASIAVAKRIFTDLGVPYEIRYLGPFNRVLAAAQSGAIDLVVTLKDNPERRAYLSFSNTVMLNPVAAFVRADKRINVTKWADLAGFRGGVARGNRFGEPFDSFLKNNLKIQEANDLETSFKMLAADRFDYVVTGFYPGRALLISAATDQKIIALYPYLSDVPNMAGFVTQSPCTSYLSAFNKELDKLIKEKFVEQAIEQANTEWRAHPVLIK
ncbi:transporter substrate-binding domain-containing protein [Undibacterium sp. RTI2.1]|uniref:substrate-binding periplasmic protein n=1 Tax=unclassified Undibacterium TaxID=2630295 RepID=UPI002AB5D807|nr:MULTISPECIES: transporter substrate-binding domain-containing protein [unclassified Undibacterium]MDY7540066.1 transporter substrate-binding domain-containing protein [Undibacterium sp. 5I1]MEB0031606.1 transporter substrate-binding domain-containing protein [Undibacterium sp. RTI2.1]MEB0117823.1 transporter substrate-binding domain-containing protein [Undibacterium sp. RTI2.2]MEB0232946.1 transporter substrate-binding domain-containing protein [Undibacterium sp. 10I3]MEB0257913.1 transport